jgi:hypothetical protein
MVMKRRFSIVVAAGSSLLAVASPAQERMQIGLYQAEQPLPQAASDAAAPPPVVDLAQWDAGDLRIRVVQSAPCGEFFPADAWAERNGAIVTVRWRWEALKADDPPRRLCRRHVEAWVFDVPQQRYDVRISPAMPRYGWRGGNVVLESAP